MTEIVNGSRDQLFTGSAFSRDQNGRIQTGNATHQIINDLASWARTDHPGHNWPYWQLLPNSSQFPFHLCKLIGPPQHDLQLRQRRRFSHVVRESALHQVHRRGTSVVVSHHHNWGAKVADLCRRSRVASEPDWRSNPDQESARRTEPAKPSLGFFPCAVQALPKTRCRVSGRAGTANLESLGIQQKANHSVFQPGEKAAGSLIGISDHCRIKHIGIVPWKIRDYFFVSCPNVSTRSYGNSASASSCPQ